MYGPAFAKVMSAKDLLRYGRNTFINLILLLGGSNKTTYEYNCTLKNSKSIYLRVIFSTKALCPAHAYQFWKIPPSSKKNPPSSFIDFITKVSDIIAEPDDNFSHDHFEL